MNRLPIILTTVTVLTCVASASNALVKMKSISYDPKRIEVTAGDSVIWKNVSYTDHSATFDEKGPVSGTGMVTPGKESAPMVFEKVGQYQYHCSVHGKTMSGVVVVKAKTK